MEWHKRAAGWLAMRTQLSQRGRALVVDDEEVMRDLFCAVLGEKFDVQAVGDAEAALGCLRAGRFDVLITDKNLPGHDGVDLIAQTRAEGFDLPAILVTGYASLETISRALSRGAADYIPKPFDDVRNVRRRVEAIVEQHRTEKLLAHVAGELKAILDAGGAEAESLQPIERSLTAFRQALAARPDVMMLEPNPRAARVIRLFLEGTGLTLVDAKDAAAVRAQVEALPPMTVLLSLSDPGVAPLIPELHAADPDLEILASGRPSDLSEALEAVGAGASDYVIGAVEGVELLGARVKRAVARARRRRLFGQLVSLLREAAGESREMQQLFADLPARAPEKAPPPAAAEEIEVEVDVSDCFEPLLGEDWASAVGTGPMGTAEAATGLDNPFTSIEEQVRWGLDGVDPERLVLVKVRDVLFVGATLKELVRFLHEPAHYAAPEALKTWLGDAEQGALGLLTRAWYQALRPHLPQDVRKDLESGRFDHPRPPYYLEPPKG